MILRKLLMLVFLAVAVCVMSAGVGAAAVITVDDSGGAMYMSIQAAIDGASLGDEIHVYSGTYYENVVVNKQLTLRGIDSGAGMPVVDAGGSKSAITLNTDGIILKGFDVINSSNGIYVTSNYNTLTSNTANNNNFFGIYLHSSSNNTLTSNTANNNDYGIYLHSSSNNTLTSNTANNNDYGIYLYYSGNNSLKNNLMSGNRYNFGVDGWKDSDFNNDIDISNLVDGKPIYYILDVSDAVIDSSNNPSFPPKNQNQ